MALWQTAPNRPELSPLPRGHATHLWRPTRASFVAVSSPVCPTQAPCFTVAVHGALWLPAAAVEARNKTVRVSTAAWGSRAAIRETREAVLWWFLTSACGRLLLWRQAEAQLP